MNTRLTKLINFVRSDSGESGKRSNKAYNRPNIAYNRQK